MSNPIIHPMLRAVLVSLRPHQWPKNLFVLGPVAFSRGLENGETVLRGGLALLVFIAASSAVYLMNDIVDRERDRLHPVKKHRPLASGQLSVRAAATVAFALAVLSFWGAAELGSIFTMLLASYLGINVLYSILLKQIVILDVMTVSLGFVIRVAAGAAAIEVEVSSWLLLCTIFVALLLSFTKRRHEILLLAETATDEREVLSSYSPRFLDQLITTSTSATLLCYALYAVAPETVAKFGSGNLVYTVPFVIFGIFRYLYLTYQISTRVNPTEAVLRDLPSLVNVTLWILVVTAIIYLL